MKKIIGIIVFLGIGSMTFSHEGWLSFNAGYGNYFENNSEKSIYTGSPGFDFYQYHFWNNFGFFIDLSFSIPVIVNDDRYTYYFQFGNIVGPAFKINITERMKMKWGLGFSYQIIVGEYNGYSLTNFNSGIGGDVNFTYILNKLVYINIGTIVNYHFGNVATTGTGTYYYNEDGDREENEIVEWTKNYSMIGLRPYIGIGLLLK
ncbi:MAG: hypothetical protein LBK61_12725 [Spirochaetaceae bacterium]|jgi:hypothetical protein|nr:hypothetical protein [Spirochaetaceae bacterium]